MFKINGRAVDDYISVLDVCGDLDVASEEAFRVALHEQIADGRRYLVLNLSDVHYMDSTAFGVLMGAMRRLARHGRIVVSGASGRVRRLFEVTGLVRVMKLFEDEDQALEHLRARLVVS
jgi:anti-anti-sigma factor